MRNVIGIIGHPTLCSHIVQQFAFMKMMSEPTDRNAAKLADLDLNDILKKADNFFVEFTAYLSVIDGHRCNLSDKLSEFLKQYSHITDVTAIQQNIHHDWEILNEHSMSLN